MNRMLKRRENPKSAPMQTQYQCSFVETPIDLSSTFPTVGSSILGSGVGYREITISVLMTKIPLKKKKKSAPYTMTNQQMKKGY